MAYLDHGPLPAGITGTGVYDWSTHTYTPAGVSLGKTKGILAKVASGTASGKIGVLGASNVSGWNGTTSFRGLKDFPQLVRGMLKAAGYRVTEGSIHLMDQSAGENRVTTPTGTWSYHSPSTAEPAPFLGSSNASSVQWVTTDGGDAISLRMSALSASFTVKVDGVLITSFTSLSRVTNAAGTLTPDGTNNPLDVVISVAYGPHTVLVTASGAMYPIECRGSATALPALEVTNYGDSGSNASMWAQSTTGINNVYYSLANRAVNDGIDVAILDLGIMVNSFDAGASTASMITDVSTVITYLQAAGIEVVLNTAPPVIDPVNGTPPTAFWQAMFTIADAKGCILIDQWTALGTTWAQTNTLGYAGSADNVHQSVSGMAAVAQNIMTALEIEAAVGSPLTLNVPVVVPQTGASNILLPYTNQASAASTGSAQNQEVWTLYLITKPTSITGLAFHVTTAAIGGTSPVARVALANDNGAGGVGTLIGTYDSGTTAVTSTLLKTVAGARVLPPGLYWTAFKYEYAVVPTTAPQFTAMNTVLTLPGPAMNSTNYRCLSRAGSAGVFASNPTVTPSTTNAPIVGILIA